MTDDFYTPTAAGSVIRAALLTRSDRTWSVINGRGTAYGWLTITAPPARLDAYGGMTDGDRAELSRLLGVEVYPPGASVPPGAASYRTWIARAEGKVETP